MGRKRRICGGVRLTSPTKSSKVPSLPTFPSNSRRNSSSSSTSRPPGPFSASQSRRRCCCGRMRSFNRRSLPQRLPHRLQQLLPRERLLEHAALVEIERAAGRLRDRAGGDEEKAALEDGHATDDLAIKRQPVDAREMKIADDHLDFCAEAPERFLR